MIEGQIRTNDVTDPGIVSAMAQIERERFVPASFQTVAYADRDLPAAESGQAGAQRSLLSPMVLGKIIRAANIVASDRVLHVGSTTGYGTAVIARIAGSVVALEDSETLTQEASKNLSGVPNVSFATGPLTAGWAPGAPYDVIVMEGAVEELPEALSAQLKEGGRLVAIVGSGRTGRGTLFRRTPAGLSGFPLFDAAAPILPGFAKASAFVF